MDNLDRLDMLQEMINIGFGRSSAAIADLLNIFVTMSVPEISDISASGIHPFLIEHIGPAEKVTLVKQIFRGDFFGETVLIVPERSNEMLVNLLANLADSSSPDWDILQEEMLLEVGNIIIGACMGKMAELLNTVLSYNIPQIVLKRTPLDQLCSENFGEEQRILVIESSLGIDSQKTRFYLFIIISTGSLGWLYQTLDKHIESFYT